VPFHPAAWRGCFACAISLSAQVSAAAPALRRRISERQRTAACGEYLSPAAPEGTVLSCAKLCYCTISLGVYCGACGSAFASHYLFPEEQRGAVAAVRRRSFGNKFWATATHTVGGILYFAGSRSLKAGTPRWPVYLLPDLPAVRLLLLPFYPAAWHYVGIQGRRLSLCWLALSQHLP